MLPHARTLQESLERLPLSGLVTMGSSASQGSVADLDDGEEIQESRPSGAVAAPGKLQAAAQPAAPTSWFGSFWTWMTGSSSSATVNAASSGNQAVSFLDTPPPIRPATPESIEETWRKRIAREARMEKSRPVLIGDAFSDMESEDGEQQRQLQQRDHALRVFAETKPRPSEPCPGMGADPMTNSASQASSFWATMADEDTDIEASLSDSSKDLSRYQRLTHVQDAQVARAASNLRHEQGVGVSRERLLKRRSDSSFEAKSIHDEFRDMEDRDAREVDQLKRSPYLRMLQLDTREKRIVA